MKKEIILQEINDDAPIREWAAKLMGEKYEEAIESVRREKVKTEFVSLIKLDGKKYLVFYMEGEMLPADMAMQVNIEHKNVMRSIVQNRVAAEPLYDLSL